MEYLNCDLIEFISHENQLLDVKYDGKLYESIKLVRAFPLTKPNSYISIRYGKENNELGIIENIDMLSLENKSKALSDLAFRYFMPEILSIKKKTLKRHFYTFDVVTTSGETKIRVKDIVYNLFLTPQGDLLIKDTDENYYIIKQFEKIKDKNMKFLKSFI